MSLIIKEACVENLEQCILAEKRGADRIELCADLIHEGLTPANDLIKQAKHQLKIPIRVMIRPRPGDFLYSKEEFQVMIGSIQQCKEIGVAGVVFGVCTPEKTLDVMRITTLVKVAKPLKITIHKAIDSCDDPLFELDRLKGQGIDSVLSSGGAPTASLGSTTLRSMVEKSGTIEIIACGKVTNQNLGEIHQLVAAPAYHGKKIVGDL